MMMTKTKKEFGEIMCKAGRMSESLFGKKTLPIGLKKHIIFLSKKTKLRSMHS